jgi:hypothetical protein
MEETGVPGENHQPVTSHWKAWLHNVVSSMPHHITEISLKVALNTINQTKPLK